MSLANGVASPRRFLASIAALPLLMISNAGIAAGQVESDILGAFETYARYGRFEIPAFDDADIDALAAGEPVVLALRDLARGGDGGTRSLAIVGARVYEVPRLLAWLTALGGNNDYRSARAEEEKSAGRDKKSRVTHAMLSRFDDGSYVRYQHIRLPWPLRDRHWAVYCRKNVAAAQASDGRVWEHFWTLDADGLAEARQALAEGRIDGVDDKMLDKSIYLPANEGAWVLVDLGGDRTLLIAYVDVDLGGNFPGGLVRRFSQKQLKAGLDALQDFMARVHTEYDEQPLVHDGRGRPIAREDAERVAAGWVQAGPGGIDGHAHP